MNEWFLAGQLCCINVISQFKRTIIVVGNRLIANYLTRHFHRIFVPAGIALSSLFWPGPYTHTQVHIDHFV